MPTATPSWPIAVWTPPGTRPFIDSPSSTDSKARMRIMSRSQSRGSRASAVGERQRGSGEHRIDSPVEPLAVHRCATLSASAERTSWSVEGRKPAGALSVMLTVARTPTPSPTRQTRGRTAPNPTTRVAVEAGGEADVGAARAACGRRRWPPQRHAPARPGGLDGGRPGRRGCEAPDREFADHRGEVERELDLGIVSGHALRGSRMPGRNAR